MTLRTFVTVLSMVLGLVGGLFFCVGSAKLNRRSIDALAGTYWDANPHLANFLRVLKAEYMCGGIALCGTFVLQFVAASPGILSDCAVFDQTWLGAIVAVLVGGGLGLLLLWLRKRLIAQLARAVPGDSDGGAL